VSVQLIGWVLDQEGLHHKDKFVLVALANRANSDTGLCCPSLNRIADDTALSRSTVIRSLAALEDMGYIQKVSRHRENGSSTSNEYRFPSVTLTRGGFQGDTPPSVTVTPPEPELRTRKEPSVAAAPRARPRNPIWDTLTEVFGEPTTRSAQKVRGKVCSSLSAARASPEEIISRAKRWPLHFDGATMTDLALEKHWDTLARQPLRRQQ
jgi:DNA-binding transcriptional MocR family regulator